MKCSVLSGLVLLASGIMGIIVSAFLGRIEIIIFLIVPVLILKGALPILSLLSFILGASLLGYNAIKRSLYNLGPMERTPKGSQNMVHHGGVLFIGPFPIFFGDGDRSVKWYVLAAILAMTITVAVTAILMLLALTLPWAR